MTELAARLLLARNLRLLRLLREWSQEELAEAAGLDRSYVSSLERGQRNVGLDVLERLAEAFGVEVAQLLTEPKAKKAGQGVLRSLSRAVEKNRLREEAAWYQRGGAGLQLALAS